MFHRARPLYNTYMNHDTVRHTIDDFLAATHMGSVAFSADGSVLFYCSNESGISQLYMMPVEGGEATQLTDFESPITTAHPAPVGRDVLFAIAQSGKENVQLYILNSDTKVLTRVTNNDAARHVFGGWSADGARIVYATNERDQAEMDVYVHHIATHERECVWRIGGLGAPLGFSPDGTSVAIRKNVSPEHRELSVLNLTTGVHTPLNAGMENMVFSKPLWEKESTSFLLLANHEQDFMGIYRHTLGQEGLRRVYVDTGDVEMLHVAEGTHAVVSVNRRGYSEVTVHTLPSFEMQEKLPLHYAVLSDLALSPDGVHLAYVASNAREASVLTLRHMESGEERMVARAKQGVSAEDLVDAELIEVPSFDGLKIPCWVYRAPQPVGAVAAPVVIDIHGGPAHQARPAFSPVVQYLVHQGWTVVRPNIRGSLGYGKAYMALDDGEKRMDAIRDVVAIREYLAAESWVDAGQIALMGASYGGFVVLSCMAHYPHLWAAGVNMVGISNFVTFLQTTAPYNRAFHEAEYGSLVHDRAFLESISPITHAANIAAPLLVIHGARDPRVPLGEAEQLVALLQEHGRAVELVVYPDEGHGIRKHKNRIDAYSRVATFFARAFSDSVAARSRV